jgi:hypothetical protein
MNANQFSGAGGYEGELAEQALVSAHARFALPLQPLRDGLQDCCWAGGWVR